MKKMLFLILGLSILAFYVKLLIIPCHILVFILTVLVGYIHKKTRRDPMAIVILIMGIVIATIGGVLGFMTTFGWITFDCNIAATISLIFVISGAYISGRGIQKA